MKNVNNIINDLAEVFEDIKSGNGDKEQAKILANLSGKMIKGAATALDQKRFLGDKTPIEFLKDTPKGIKVTEKLPEKEDLESKIKNLNK